MARHGRILTTSLLCGLFLVPLPLSAQTLLKNRSLQRHEDFVVIIGKDVESLKGVEVAGLRLYSCNPGGCGPIPIQVDKVDQFGRYVFPQEVNRDRDGSRLDENDEISFMAGDAGGRIAGGWKPSAASRGMEIELSDPQGGGRAWVYLFEEPDTMAPDVPDYVDYVKTGDNVLIKSDRFTIGYRKGRITYDAITMLSPAGGFGPDLLDRQRVGLEAQLLGDLSLPINVPDSIIRADDVGVIDGPVRVIVDTAVLVNVGVIETEWGTEYFVKFYRCGQNNVGHYEFPAALKDVFRTVMLYWGADFTQDLIGSYYVDANHPDSMLITDEVRTELPGDKDHFWLGIYGQNGVLLMAVNMDEQTAKYITCTGKWKQNPNPSMKRGDNPGRLEIGFKCHEKESVPGMTDYFWQNYILFPGEPSPESLGPLRDIFEHPLGVRSSHFTLDSAMDGINDK